MIVIRNWLPRLQFHLKHRYLERGSFCHRFLAGDLSKCQRWHHESDSNERLFSVMFLSWLLVWWTNSILQFTQINGNDDFKNNFKLLQCLLSGTEKMGQYRESPRLQGYHAIPTGPEVIENLKLSIVRNQKSWVNWPNLFPCFHGMIIVGPNSWSEEEIVHDEAYRSIITSISLFVVKVSVREAFRSRRIPWRE